MEKQTPLGVRKKTSTGRPRKRDLIGKAVTKKATVRKTTAGKAATKKATVRKTTAGKAATKKTMVKKVGTKKAAVKKAAVKKVVMSTADRKTTKKVAATVVDAVNKVAAGEIDAKKASKKPVAKKASTRKRRGKVAADTKPLADMPTSREIHNRRAKRILLEAYAKYGTVTRACKEAGVSRSCYYLWTSPRVARNYGLDPANHYDPEFHEAALDAYHGRFQDRVMDAGIERAIDGWIEKHYDRNGNIVREEPKYDSAVLQMLMKRADPALKDKSDINVDARDQSSTVINQRAVVLDHLTPQQKKLLLQAASLAPAVDDQDDDVPSQTVREIENSKEVPLEVPQEAFQEIEDVNG